MSGAVSGAQSVGGGIEPVGEGYEPEADSIPFERGSRASWNDVVAQMRSYVSEKEDERLLFVSEDGEKVRAAEYEHRLRESYQRWQYARMNSLARGLRERWPDGQATMITLTTSTTDSNGNPRPPTEVLDELRQSWGHVRVELSKGMNGVRKGDPEAVEWEYLKILEGTTNRGEVIGGFPHIHVAVFTEHPVPKSRFRGAIEKHIDKAPSAKAEAHRIDGQSVSQSSFGNLDALGAYLHAYAGNEWGERSPPQERFDAVMWATGARQFSMSQGCSEAIEAGDTRPEREWGPLQAERPIEWEFMGAYDVRTCEKVQSYGSVAELEVATGMGLPTFLSGATERETESGVHIGESVGVTEEGAYLVGEFPDRFLTFDWSIVVAHLTNKQDGDILNPPRGRPPPIDR